MSKSCAKKEKIFLYKKSLKQKALDLKKFQVRHKEKKLKNYFAKCFLELQKVEKKYPDHSNLSLKNVSMMALHSLIH